MKIKTKVRCEYCRKELPIEEAVKTTGIGWKGFRTIYYHGACQLPATIRDIITYSPLVCIGVVICLVGLFLLSWLLQFLGWYGF